MRLKLHTILAEWPRSRAYASGKQVSQLIGVLMHVSFAARSCLFFDNRLLFSVVMPRIAPGADLACRMAKPGRRFALGPEFYCDLECWRWFVEGLSEARGWTLSAPTYRFLSTPLDVLWFLTHLKPLAVCFAMNRCILAVRA